MKEGFAYNNNTIEGFDVVDPVLNAVQSIADGLNVGLSIVGMIFLISSPKASLFIISSLENMRDTFPLNVFISPL